MSTPTFLPTPRIYDDAKNGVEFNPADMLVRIGWAALDAVDARRLDWLPTPAARVFYFRVGSLTGSMALVAQTSEDAYSVEVGRGSLDAHGRPQWVCLGFYRRVRGSRLGAVVEHAVARDLEGR